MRHETPRSIAEKNFICILPAVADYKEKLLKLDLLPIPLYSQMREILILSIFCANVYDIDVSAFLSILSSLLRENRNIPQVQHPRSEVMHQKFFYGTRRLIGMLPAVDSTNHGLKAVVLRCMWQHFEEKYSEMNVCSCKIGCRCSNCHVN